MNAVSFSKGDCITPLFKLIFHEAIKYFVKGMPHCWNFNVYIFNFYLGETLPFSDMVLSLWKTYHICSTIYVRHGALFQKECCAHLRVLLHTNVALPVKEYCMDVCHNFLKACYNFFNGDWWEACGWPDNLSWYCVEKHRFFQENSMLTVTKLSISL